MTDTLKLEEQIDKILSDYGHFLHHPSGGKDIDETRIALLSLFLQTAKGWIPEEPEEVPEEIFSTDPDAYYFNGFSNAIDKFISNIEEGK